MSGPREKYTNMQRLLFVTFLLCCLQLLHQPSYIWNSVWNCIPQELHEYLCKFSKCLLIAYYMWANSRDHR